MYLMYACKYVCMACIITMLVEYNTLEGGKDNGIAALEVVFGFHVTQPAEERSSYQSVSIELLVVLVSYKHSNLTWVVPYKGFCK